MRLRLATKFSATILGVVGLAILSSLVTLYAAWRISARLEEAKWENSSSVGAEQVEVAIFEGNNLLASHLLDQGNPEWEKEYCALKPSFQSSITSALDAIRDSGEDKERALLLQLEKVWNDLDVRREEVIALCKKGDTGRAREILLKEINALSTEANGLCGQLIGIHEESATESVKRAERRMRVTTSVVGIASVLTLLLGASLLWLFFYRVLFPLRGMVADAQLYRGVHRTDGNSSEEDELRIMGHHLRTLMSDVSDTRSRLDRSRDQLLAAEKLASVGKLAASVAHEIRNPLTAMKMWLFSIAEAVRGNADLGRKIGIISEEIARLESIVRNFLEFSRPLTLHRQPQDVSTVIEQTLELLGPRFQGEKICITYSPKPALPPVMADAAQLKQVLLNLLGNAADAMTGGGEIRISTNAEKDGNGRSMLVVRICDTGPGMPQEIQSRIFEPFFTTKENGSGLGLCIAAQVMARHDGGLVLESSTEKGTTFAVWMPVAPEEGNGQNPCC